MAPVTLADTHGGVKSEKARGPVTRASLMGLHRDEGYVLSPIVVAFSIVGETPVGFQKFR